MLIGRKFLFQFGDGDLLYNGICDALYAALYETENTPMHFQESSVVRIKEFLDDKTLLKNEIELLLSDIETTNICIVETGVHGTMPLLLKACDKRINHIMLYTTLPWFYSSWGQCCFTKKYEGLRMFETLNCQDKLFSFSHVKNKVFYVREIDDNKTIEESLAELNYWSHVTRITQQTL
jgi:hypothetical protein